MTDDLSGLPAPTPTRTVDADRTVPPGEEGCYYVGNHQVRVASIDMAAQGRILDEAEVRRAVNKGLVAAAECGIAPVRGRNIYVTTSLAGNAMMHFEYSPSPEQPAGFQGIALDYTPARHDKPVLASRPDSTRWR